MRLPELKKKYQQLLDLKRSQWAVILQAPIVLLLSWARLRTGGFQQTLEQIHPKPEPVMSAEQQLLWAKETAYALAVAVKFGPWRPKCLLRSLALGWFLARRGIPFEIRIGVPAGQAMPQAGGSVDFTAHAWVEVDGVVINDREDIAGEYAIFDCGSGFSRDNRG